MSVSRDRDLVTQIAAIDPARARERALAIAEPLYRAQALAWAARFAPAADVLSTATLALAACAAAGDPYQQVAGAAWPIRALIERDLSRAAEDAVTQAIVRARMVPNPVSRADALFLLWQAAYLLGPVHRARILTPLVEAAKCTHSWRPRRVLQSIALILAADERALAESIIAEMPEGRHRSATERRFAAGEQQTPRPFFRNHAA